MSGPASVELCPEIPRPCARLFGIAERDPRRAVGLARRRQDCAAELSPLEQALALYALGYAWLRWERLDEAEAALAEACQRLTALGEGRLVLHVRRALLYAAVLRGAALADAWADLAAEYDRAGDPLGAARARLGQMVPLNLRGDAQAVLELAERIAPLLERDGAPGDRAWLLRLRAVALVSRAAFDAALACLDQAAAIFTELGQPAELAKTWLEYSNLYTYRSEPVRAAHYIELAYPYVQKLDLKLRVAFCTKNMGWFAALQGEYDRGVQLSLQAYDQFAVLQRADYMAGCDLNLGNVAFFAGLWDLALIAYQRAETVYDTLGQERMRLFCCQNLAQVHCLSGRPEAALVLAQALIDAADRLGERVEGAKLLLTQGRALAALGQTGMARRKLAQAEARFRRLGNQADAGECLVERAWLNLGQRDRQRAEALFQRARPLLDDWPIFQWRVDYGLGRCAELSGDLDRALDLYCQAGHTVAGLRRRLANEHASSGLFAKASQLAEDAIRLAWQLGDAETLLSLAELQRALALTARMREEQTRPLAAYAAAAPADRPAWAEPGTAGELDLQRQQDLQAYLERRLRRRRPLPQVEDEPGPDLALGELRESLARAFPDGWTLVDYIFCAEQILIVIVTPDAIEVEATPCDARLRQLLRKVSDPDYQQMSLLGEGTPWPAGAAAWPTLAELGERLIPARLRDRLAPKQRLLIVASGPLHGLPWAALRVGAGWLVEQATPQLLPGLRIWQELRYRRPAGDAALLLGVSQFDQRGEELIEVSAMLDVTAARWPGQITRLEQAEATLTTLLERAGRGELRRYGLLHFATHGQLIAASGLYAHLKLADGDLSYDDVLGLGLGGALVVLAACDGAAAEVLPGEEVLSLSRAFLAAGARDVIASAWQLYEGAARPFLGLLYANLAAGRDPPAALAAAQRTWLRRSSGDKDLDALYHAPLVWAGLSVIGAG